jgi:predicted RNase H-like HicB family nuclease
MGPIRGSGHEIGPEEGGRWIAAVTDPPGVLACGQTPQEAEANVQALSLLAVADRMEHEQAGPIALVTGVRASTRLGANGKPALP